MTSPVPSHERSLQGSCRTSWDRHWPALSPSLYLHFNIYHTHLWWQQIRRCQSAGMKHNTHRPQYDLWCVWWDVKPCSIYLSRYGTISHLTSSAMDNSNCT